MKRVLYVNHEVELGGAERSLLDLITGLRRDRFEVHLACSKPGPLAAAAGGLGATIHEVPMLFAGKLRKLFGLFRAGLHLRKLIRAHSIDILHANTLIAGYCGSLGARLAGIPCVWHVRDLDYPEVAKSVVARVDLILANSQATASTLRNGRDLGDKLKIVYNAVPDSFFDQTPAGDAVRRELALPADENLVGMVGRLDPQKGHLEFLDAAKQVLARRDATFVIAGDVLFDQARERLHGYREHLENRARELGIFGKVVFLGQRDDVPRLLSAMDVLVHPSQMVESFGRSIAEAHAVGCPVVASDLGGIPEIVRHGVNGYLFDAADTGSMAARILCLLDDPEARTRMGARGKADAAERFRRSTHVERVQELYENLLG